jgi:hypothetical protein
VQAMMYERVGRGIGTSCVRLYVCDAYI